MPIQSIFNKMMKKLVALIITLTSLHLGYAETEPKEGEPLLRKPSRAYQFGGIQDNWFVGVNAGGAIYFGDHDKQMDLGKRISPKFEVYAGKWFDDRFGARLGLGGFQYKGATQDPNLGTGKVWDASQNLQYQKFNYLNVNADFMFNWLNDVNGYSEQRLYSLIPYAGVGLMIGIDHTKKMRVSPSLGILQTFRLSESLDLNIDVRGNIHGDGFDGEFGGRNAEGSLAALVGLNFKIW